MKILKKCNKERVVIFGTGTAAKNFVPLVRSRFEIVAYMDNDETKHGIFINSIPVLPPSAISTVHIDSIIIASDFFEEIYHTLKSQAHFEKIPLIYYRSIIIQKPLLKNWCDSFSNWCLTLICRIPIFASALIRPIIRPLGYDLLPTASLDVSDSNKVQTFRQAEKQKIAGPKFIDRPQVFSEVIIPEVAAYRFKQAQLSLNSRAFAIANEKLVIEKVHTVSKKLAKYSKGHVVHHFEDKRALIKTSVSRIVDKGILINGYYDLNYYHWIVEILPQLEYLKELDEIFANYPLIISHMAFKIESVREMLSLFNLPNPIIEITSLESLRVNDLLIINSPNRCCPAILGAAWSLPEYIYYRRDSLFYMRDLVLGRLDKSCITKVKRIFLAPSLKHRYYNQEEIFALFDRYGFKKVNPEKMSISEQASIFSQADYIVGPTGATWTNLLFAKRGASALCWMAEEWGHFSAFSNLANIIEVDLSYLTYKAGINDDESLYSKSYSLNSSDVKLWLDQQTFKAEKVDGY
ncbi:glycosyltransferase family 61 protein [Alteromonas sp. ASW11-130]|uniref:glycosyltransferase family 61 protein n=1 Tax=Alteromonas sp. ASW11-130 TaxID=3015775 RepID=UPI0022424AD5|nr:glycosyltransferase 61 family protein [Alteromonas sp. ASW11-130]MCW8090344.1 glycosyltransferase 61 family protein [Alteromonas sp. ASW11-130]